VEDPEGNRGGGENDSECSVSKSRIAVKEFGDSHVGGEIFARLCFFSRRANQRGMSFLCGGMRAGVVPYR
jgi:hypothetical protein